MWDVMRQARRWRIVGNIIAEHAAAMLWGDAWVSQVPLRVQSYTAGCKCASSRPNDWRSRFLNKAMPAVNADQSRTEFSLCGSWHTPSSRNLRQPAQNIDVIHRARRWRF